MCVHVKLEIIDSIRARAQFNQCVCVCVYRGPLKCDRKKAQFHCNASTYTHTHTHTLPSVCWYYNFHAQFVCSDLIENVGVNTYSHSFNCFSTQPHSSAHSRTHEYHNLAHNCACMRAYLPLINKCVLLMSGNRCNRRLNNSSTLAVAHRERRDLVY